MSLLPLLNSLTAAPHILLFLLNLPGLHLLLASGARCLMAQRPNHRSPAATQLALYVDTRKWASMHHELCRCQPEASFKWDSSGSACWCALKWA